jgi:hypothetical protein
MTAFGRTTMGHVSWNELRTPDQAGALGFYGSIFGVSKSGSMPMGEMGDYTFLQRRGWCDDDQSRVAARRDGLFRVHRICENQIASYTRHSRPMEVRGEMVLNAVDPQGCLRLIAPGVTARRACYATDTDPVGAVLFFGCYGSPISVSDTCRVTFASTENGFSTFRS